MWCVLGPNSTIQSAAAGCAGLGLCLGDGVGGGGSERGEGWVSVDLGLEVEDLGLLFENETAKCAK